MRVSLDTIPSSIACRCEVLGDLDLGASFWPGYRARASWLVGLLMLQSASSFILAGEQDLLSAHPVVVYFLTMLVGAGGNAGNQSAVRVIRGLAVGALTEKTVKPFLLRELYMAMAITATLVLFGGARVVFFHGSGRDALVVTTSLALIVSASIIIGALLPLVMHRLRLDAAHAGTSIQVVMDILGETAHKQGWARAFFASARFQLLHLPPPLARTRPMAVSCTS